MDNPFDFSGDSGATGGNNPFDFSKSAPKPPQSNPFDFSGQEQPHGRQGMGYPSLGLVPDSSPGTPKGMGGMVDYPGVSDIIKSAGELNPATGQVEGQDSANSLANYLAAKLPNAGSAIESATEGLTRFLLTKPPDIPGHPLATAGMIGLPADSADKPGSTINKVLEKAGATVNTGVQAAKDATEGLTKFLLTKPPDIPGHPLATAGMIGLPASSADKLAKDIGGYLFEGGNVTEMGSAASHISGEDPKAFIPVINDAAKKYGVEPGLLARQLQQENGFKVHGTSPAGAQGIAQFMPGTAEKYGVDVNDPVSSINGQAHYMSDLKKMFGGNDGLALAGYNWGEGHVQKWLRAGADPSTMPAETRNYVKSITGQSIEDWMQGRGRAPEGIRERAIPTREEIFAGKKNLSDDMLLSRDSEIRAQLDRIRLEDPNDTFGHAQDLEAEDALIKDRLNPEEPEAPSPNGISPSLAAAQSASAARTPVGRLAEHNIASFEAANKAPGFKQQVKDATSYARSFFADTDKAKSIIQKNLGREKRAGAQAVFAMQKFKSMLNDATIDEQLDLLKWLQDPQSKLSEGKQLTPEAQSFVDTFHDWMQHYQKKLQALPQSQKMNFRSNFVTQLWRQPKTAMAYINQYGAKRGSGYFTKARVFDDYEAGIRAGFAPVTTNPMEIFSRYIENASQKIAWWESINDAKNNGMIVYRALQNAPQGWVEVKSMQPLIGQHAFAPPGLARIFDNYASTPKRLNIPGTQIDVLETAQRAANTATAFKLAISGFHPALETMEGLFSGISNGITKLKNGRPVAGIAEVLTAGRKPFTSVSRGRRLQKAYLDGVGTPETQRIVDALTDANYDFMREGGLSDEYRVSRLPGFIKGWSKGIPMTAGGPLKMGVRAFETAMEPVFQYYVPWLKNQAAYDAMKTYLDAHPNISSEDFAAYGRKVANTMDARFGEMNKNNIFWDATSKRMAQTAMISWSFTLGQARQALGAAWDAARMPDKMYSKAKGKLPSTEEIWTDRLSYAVAIGLGTALVNSVYQYMKTGQLPQDTQDLLHPRTGGIDSTTKKPERATLPNFANSYMNIWENGPGKEAYAKMSPLWQTLTEVAMNKDYKEQPIRDPNDTVMAQLEQTRKYVIDFSTKFPFLKGQLAQPITFGVMDQAKKGTNISLIEREFGLRPAGMRYTDPTTLKKIVSYKDAEAWYLKRKTEVNQLRSQKGQSPLRLPYKTKQHLIEQYMRNPQSDPLQKYGGTQ